MVLVMKVHIQDTFMSITVIILMAPGLDWLTRSLENPPVGPTTDIIMGSQVQKKRDPFRGH